MLYAITFTLGGFANTNTIIVETAHDPAENYIFADETDDIRQALLDGSGLDPSDVDEVMENKSYFIRNCADVDAYVK